MPGARFPRHLRIRNGSEIRSLLRRGYRERTGHFDVYCSDARCNHSRFGVIVPKHRHNIVERNRLKRRIREVGRTELLPMLSGAAGATDVLVRARPEAYTLSFEQIKSELEGAMAAPRGRSR